MKSRVIASVLVLLGFWGAIQLINFDNKTNACVNMYIDFGSLDNNSKITKCVPADGKIGAVFVMDRAGIKMAGTDQYGMQVLCRVNGLPDYAHEKCAKMPPENAYWAVLIKKGSSIYRPDPQWGWAQTGISDVYLYPGDSLGLVFTTDGKVKWPS